MPGTYTVRLIAGGKTQSEPIKVVMDPRVKTSDRRIWRRSSRSKSIYDATLQRDRGNS